MTPSKVRHQLRTRKKTAVIAKTSKLTFHLFTIIFLNSHFEGFLVLDHREGSPHSSKVGFRVLVLKRFFLSLTFSDHSDIIEMNGDVKVVTNVHNGDLSVNGDAQVTTEVHNGDISVTGELKMTPKVVNGNIGVTGDVYFNGNVSLSGNLLVTGNLIMSDDANLTVLVSRNNAQTFELV